jgi:hypothetical protein
MNFDPAVTVMALYYVWGCSLWGNWKADEYKYSTESPSKVKEYLLCGIHAGLAPFSMIWDLFKR